MVTLCSIAILALAATAFSEPSSQPSQNCPANEVFRTCGTACEPSCAIPKFRSCIESCVTDTCQCASGFYRNTYDKCVKIEDCEYSVTCKDIKCSNGSCSQDKGCPRPPPVCDDGSKISCANVNCKPGYRCEQIRVNCLIGPCPQPAPICIPNK